MKSFEAAKLNGTDLRIAIVAARWNSNIVDKLMEGARRALRDCDVPDEQTALYRCPGSYELPIVVRQCALSASFDAVIALGCVIRGETLHFELVANAASEGIMRVMLDTGVPCIFGVVTTENEEQALARSGDGNDNKGYESVVSAIDVVQQIRSVS